MQSSSSLCVCVCVKERKGKCIHCIPTKARHSLQASLQADLLQTKVAVPEQATPQEHPVQTCTVVHDDYTPLPRNEAITRYHHLHPEHQLQQGLQKGETPGCRGDEEVTEGRM